MLGQRLELLRTEDTVEFDNSRERRETLRRAEEALKRAEHWAIWMESVETENSCKQYRRPISPHTARILTKTGGSTF